MILANSSFDSCPFKLTFLYKTTVKRVYMSEWMYSLINLACDLELRGRPRDGNKPRDNKINVGEMSIQCQFSS